MILNSKKGKGYVKDKRSSVRNQKRQSSFDRPMNTSQLGYKSAVTNKFRKLLQKNYTKAMMRDLSIGKVQIHPEKKNKKYIEFLKTKKRNGSFQKEKPLYSSMDKNKMRKYSFLQVNSFHQKENNITNLVNAYKRNKASIIKSVKRKLRVIDIFNKITGNCGMKQFKLFQKGKHDFNFSITKDYRIRSKSISTFDNRAKAQFIVNKKELENGNLRKNFCDYLYKKKKAERKDALFEQEMIEQSKIKNEDKTNENKEELIVIEEENKKDISEVIQKMKLGIANHKSKFSLKRKRLRKTKVPVLNRVSQLNPDEEEFEKRSRGTNSTSLQRKQGDTSLRKRVPKNNLSRRNNKKYIQMKRNVKKKGFKVLNNSNKAKRQPIRWMILIESLLRIKRITSAINIGYYETMFGDKIYMETCQKSENERLFYFLEKEIKEYKANSLGL